MVNLISIIVPCYNVGCYLHQCVASLVSQTYKNIEIILVDDGSSDDTGKLCDEYGKKDVRIKVIHKLMVGWFQLAMQVMKLLQVIGSVL